jgi:hypothetical protein
MSQKPLYYNDPMMYFTACDHLLRIAASSLATAVD